MTAVDRIEVEDTLTAHPMIPTADGCRWTCGDPTCWWWAVRGIPGQLGADDVDDRARTSHLRHFAYVLAQAGLLDLADEEELDTADAAQRAFEGARDEAAA